MMDEEKKLKALIANHQPLKVIAAKLWKSENAVMKKMRRLGLEEEGARLRVRASSSLRLPKALPSVEEALKILAGALQKSAEAGLDSIEVQRLQVVATLAKTYKEILADYTDYREIERELVEMEAKYAELAREKAKDNVVRPDSSVARAI